MTCKITETLNPVVWVIHTSNYIKLQIVCSVFNSVTVPMEQNLKLLFYSKFKIIALFKDTTVSHKHQHDHTGHVLKGLSQFML